MFSAWGEFRRGKGKKSEVQQFECTLEDNIFQLRDDLAAGTYQPLPYTSFYVRDPKLRHIHKANIRDRVLHQAVFRVLYPLFDRHFIYDSYASRFGKGVHAAVNRLRVFSRKVSENYHQPVFALQCDIRKFFDSVDQRLLLECIAERVADARAFELIQKVVHSFEKSSKWVPGKGLPLGNVTSQLFANIYLNKLDQFMKEELGTQFYIRYCDDFVMLESHKKHFPEMILRIEQFLAERLQLQLHPKKVTVRKYSRGIDFLGYVERLYYRTLRTRTKWRIVRRINEKNADSYFGILKHCRGYTLAQACRKLLTNKKL